MLGWRPEWWQWVLNFQNPHCSWVVPVGFQQVLSDAHFPSWLLEWLTYRILNESFIWWRPRPQACPRWPMSGTLAMIKVPDTMYLLLLDPQPGTSRYDSAERWRNTLWWKLLPVLRYVASGLGFEDSKGRYEIPSAAAYPWNRPSACCAYHELLHHRSHVYWGKFKMPGETNEVRWGCCRVICWFCNGQGDVLKVLTC